MFLSRNKSNSVYPCKPKFYYIKVGFKGVKIIEACCRNVKKIYHIQYVVYSDIHADIRPMGYIICIVLYRLIKGCVDTSKVDAYYE